MRGHSSVAEFDLLGEERISEPDRLLVAARVQQQSGGMTMESLTTIRHDHGEGTSELAMQTSPLYTQPSPPMHHSPMLTWGGCWRCTLFYMLVIYPASGKDTQLPCIRGKQHPSSSTGSRSDPKVHSPGTLQGPCRRPRTGSLTQGPAPWEALGMGLAPRRAVLDTQVCWRRRAIGGNWGGARRGTP